MTDSPLAFPRSVRVGITHDYLTQRGGAERVVLSMLKAFPDARLRTSVYCPTQTYAEFLAYDVETSWLNRLPLFRADPRRALPLLATAWSRHPMSEVDVVICSSSGWSHGVRSPAPKLVYCHNPPRWLYQRSDYVSTPALPVRAALSVLDGRLRRWDRAAALQADRYLTNSTTVQNRVQQAYGISARVLPPPIGIDPTGIREAIAGLTPGFFLIVGRPRGYKNVDLVTRAFASLPGQRLFVVGADADPSWSPNVMGIGAVTDAQFRWLYANCHALIAAAHEDFGLTPLEANAFGRPSLCLRAGGYLDTLEPGVSGLWIEELNELAIAATVERSLQHGFDEDAILAHANNYSESVFAGALRAEVAAVVAGRAGAFPGD